MPLPANSTLSLQGHAGHGMAQQLKPKQAMIVRMSAETFEALEAQATLPKVEVEFGDNPGLVIGEQFFPMRSRKEEGPHELYNRLQPKPSAPLKFYASVTGKFMVERQLGERVTSAVRDRAIVAEKQRVERKTIMLDKPLSTAPVTVKPVKKKVRSTVVDSHRTLSASSSTQSSRLIPARPPPVATRDTKPLAKETTRSAPPPKDIEEGVVGRLIHFLALQPRTIEEILKMVGGGTTDPETLKRVLVKFADPAAHLSGGKWLLKTEAWLQVRPFEYPELSLTERANLASKAQGAYQTLQIPENDPRWRHVRREATKKTAVASSSAESSRPPTWLDHKAKREGKEAMGKSRATEPIPAKNEGRPLKIDVSKQKDKESDKGSSTSASTSATMKALSRRPGSGYKVKSNTPPTPDLPPHVAEKKLLNGARTASASSPAAIERHAASLPPPPPRERRPSISSNASTTHVPQRTHTSRTAESDRERGRDSPAPSFRQKRKRTALDDMESEYSDRDSSMLQKRRRVQEAPPQQQRGEKFRERDLSLPKKPVAHDELLAPRREKPMASSSMRSSLPPARSPMMNNRSPLPGHSPLPAISSPLAPPRRIPSDRERMSPAVSHRSNDDYPHRNVSAKLRRKSPIYTDSEDEEAAPRAKIPRREEPRVDRAGRIDRVERVERVAPLPQKKPRRPQLPHVLPTNAVELRRLYDRLWSPYIKLFERHVTYRKLCTDLMGRLERDEASDHTDEEIDLPPPEELRALKEELESARADLTKIREAHERLRNAGNNVDEPLPRPKPID